MKRPLDIISIKGYKSIRELTDFHLSPLNIMIGANGAGKTNFISTFKLLNQIVDENLQVFVGQSGGANSLLYYGQKKTELIEISLTFGDNGYICSLIPASGDTLIFSDEEIWYHKKNFSDPYQVSIGKGQKETRLHIKSWGRPEKSSVDHVLVALRGWRLYHFHDTSATAKVKQSGNINDNEVLRSDASNLAAFLYLLRRIQPAYYKKIISTIRLVAPFFDDFRLRPNPLNPNTIQLEWQEIGSDAYFNAHVFSDGTLRFICLATLLLQPNLPSMILIDEPELGLHPYAITMIASLLRSAASQTQVIVATQSVPLVNQFDPEDIVAVDRKENQSTFEHLTDEGLEHWLDNYGLGDLWEKNLLGGRPR